MTKKRSEIPPKEELLKYFDYNEMSGELTYKKRTKYTHPCDSNRGSINKRVAGKPAGMKRRHGYESIVFKDKFYFSHRVIWMMMTGEQPPLKIDHIDGNPSNNSWSNLRDALEIGSNSRNMKPQKKSKTKLAGVGWHNQSGKWRSRCQVDGKGYHIGLYDFQDFDKACMDLLEFKVEKGFDFSHGIVENCHVDEDGNFDPSFYFYMKATGMLLEQYNEED